MGGDWMNLTRKECECTSFGMCRSVYGSRCEGGNAQEKGREAQVKSNRTDLRREYSGVEMRQGEQGSRRYRILGGGANLLGPLLEEERNEREEGGGPKTREVGWARLLRLCCLGVWVERKVDYVKAFRAEALAVGQSAPLCGVSRQGTWYFVQNVRNTT